MDIIIIKLLFNYNIFNKYYNLIDLDFIKSNSQQIERLLVAIQHFHEKYPGKGIDSAEELEVFYFTLYPPISAKDKENMEPLFRRLSETTVSEEIADEYFKGQAERQRAAKIALLGLQVSEGTKDFSELLEATKTLEKERADENSFEFVTDNPDEGRPVQGIRWPLETMNKMMGSLRKGNFGFIFARPESGKTTFLAHFVGHAAKQINDGPILWFNNEQPGIEVLHRCMQAYFGITSNEFYSKKKEYNEKYYLETGGKIKIVDDATISKKRVESICYSLQPSLIIFDQIDKIRGFSDDRNDLELKAIYQWARELSKRYGPTIGVCQAGGSGEGKKWLGMDDVDNSKTSKQGEADWILGIGKSNQEGMESVRHLYLSKNKLLGDADTDPTLRHGKADILIRADIGRYEDIKK